MQGIEPSQHDIPGNLRCRIEVCPISIHLRKGDCRDTEQIAFRRCGHGSRIGGVVTQIRTVIYPGAADVWSLFVRKDLVYRERDAIGRRTGNGICARVNFAQPQWRLQRQRMRGAGLICFRRDGPNVGRQLESNRLQNLKPFSVVSAIWASPSMTPKGSVKNCGSGSTARTTSIKPFHGTPTSRWSSSSGSAHTSCSCSDTYSA